MLVYVTLKIKARMMRAAERGPKQESIQDCGVSTNTFGYSVKFEVPPEKSNNQWALQKCFSFVAVGLAKNTGTLRWLIVQET